MSDSPPIKNNGLTHLQPNHHHHNPDALRPSANLVVGDMSFRPNSALTPGLEGETNHPPHPEPTIPSKTNHGQLEPGFPNIRDQCMDSHPISCDQLISSGRANHGGYDQHYQPTQPEPPFLPSTRPCPYTVGANLCTSQWGTTSSLSTSDYNITTPHSGEGGEAECPRNIKGKQQGHGGIPISAQSTKNRDSKPGRASRARILRTSLEDSHHIDTLRDSRPKFNAKSNKPYTKRDYNSYSLP
ncbi:hypothetical protein FXO38_07740 [Capsicum annuum]|nr:hypothetical protein FXO38_07740 [Capsicum annuum]